MNLFTQAKAQQVHRKALYYFSHFAADKGTVASKYMVIPLIIATILCSASVHSQDDGTVILSDTVTGNQEQPKVLYIVPWQAALDNTMLEAELVTKLQNDVFEHIERPEHKRQLELLRQLDGGMSEAD